MDLQRNRKNEHLEDKRPTCSCGTKMTFVQYKGYYDEFCYWQCEVCDVEDEFAADDTEKGSYA